jgi:allantoinase
VNSDYPRDLVGYAGSPPIAHWPGGASIAVQFVLNYEEGSERTVLDGDDTSETFLSEMVGAAPFTDRHMSMESLYEYGSRAGFWRLLRIFERAGLPLTVFATATALARNPAAAAAITAAGHEVAGHGLRWVSYQNVDEATEAAHLAEAVEILTRVTGSPPLGWYTGRDSPNTRRLIVLHGGFLYDADSYADDLPYCTSFAGLGNEVVTNAMDTND